MVLDFPLASERYRGLVKTSRSFRANVVALAVELKPYIDGTIRAPRKLKPGTWGKVRIDDSCSLVNAGYCDDALAFEIAIMLATPAKFRDNKRIYFALLLLDVCDDYAVRMHGYKQSEAERGVKWPNYSSRYGDNPDTVVAALDKEMDEYRGSA